MHYSRIKIYLAFCSFLPIFHGKAQLVQKNVGNPDSLFEAFIVSAKQLNLDSSSQNKFSLDAVTDRFNFKESVLSLSENLSGKVSLTDEFGLLTAYVNPNSTAPLHVLRTEGDLRLPIFNMPLQLNYRYSTFQNPIGVNNYVRLHFDPAMGKQLLASKKNEAVQQLDELHSSLDQKQTLLQGKLGMAEVYLLQQKEQLLNSAQLQEALNAQIGELETQIQNEQSDSLRQDLAQKKDSLQRQKENAEQQLNKAKENLEKLQAVYGKLMSMYQLLLDAKEQIEDKKKTLQAFNSGDLAKPQLSKMDIGLCYPSFSGLSTNLMPMKGFETEFTKGLWYYSVAGGITLNNLMVSTNVIDNKLINAQNFFNQFDYQNLKEQNWMGMVKTGYGDKDGTHAYVGFRYVTTAAKLGAADTIKAPGAGLELDLQWQPKWRPNMKFGLIYGKTSVQTTAADSTTRNAFSTLFSGVRSNAALLTYTQKIPVLKSEVKLGARWIDPFADNRSFGIVQANNFRVEVKTNTKLGSNMSIGLNARRDQNNLLNASDTTIFLSYFGCTLESQLFRNIHVSLNGAYLAQQTIIKNAQSQTRGNYIGSIQLSSPFELFETPHLFQFVFSDYFITDQLSSGSFTSVQTNLSSKLNQGINQFGLSYFKMNDPQILDGHSTIISNDFTKTGSKLQWTAGVKCAVHSTLGTTFGGKAELKYAYSKTLQLSFRAEKLVFGDFYQYYNPGRFDRFPYAFCSKLNYTIQ
jgi:hypothetical protein